MNIIINTKPIILVGTFVFSFTLLRKFDLGNAPSLAIAKPIRDVTVIDENPEKNMFMSNKTVIKTAPDLQYTNSDPSNEVNDC